MCKINIISIVEGKDEGLMGTNYTRVSHKSFDLGIILGS